MIRRRILGFHSTQVYDVTSTKQSIPECKPSSNSKNILIDPSGSAYFLTTKQLRTILQLPLKATPECKVHNLSTPLPFCDILWPSHGKLLQENISKTSSKVTVAIEATASKVTRTKIRRRRRKAHRAQKSLVRSESIPFVPKFIVPAIAPNPWVFPRFSLISFTSHYYLAHHNHHCLSIADDSLPVVQFLMVR